MIDYPSARAHVLEEVAEMIQSTPDQLDLYSSFAEIGLDSLDAVHMVATIESLIGQELPEDIIQRVGCLNDILEMMRERIAAA